MSFWQDWLQAIADWISSNGWNQRPTSVLFIVITNLLIALTSTIITKLVTDTDELNATMKRVNAWNQKRKRAMARADKKLWLTVKREEDAIKKLQQSMMMKRMKPMLFTFVPFMLIFAMIRRAFPSGDTGHWYAWLPFSIGRFPFLGNPWGEVITYEGIKYTKISFTFWYFLSSFAFGTLISRIFGTNPQGAVQTKEQKKSQKRAKATRANKTSKSRG